MEFSKSDVLKVNNMVFSFVLKLGDEEIMEVLEGRKKLNLVDVNKVLKKESGGGYEFIEELKGFKSKEEGRAFMISKKLTVAMLKGVARDNDIYFKSKDKKEELIDRIVEGTIGARNKMNILKGDNL